MLEWLFGRLGSEGRKPLGFLGGAVVSEMGLLFLNPRRKTRRERVFGGLDWINVLID